MDKHEMYCAGHMIEAGVAYYQATGKRKLLDVCIRMADHMMSLLAPANGIGFRGMRRLNWPLLNSIRSLMIRNTWIFPTG